MAAQPEIVHTSSSMTHALLGEFDHEMQNTRRTLERVPEDKLTWKPHEKSFSMGALATHLASINHWVAAVFSSDSFDVSTAPKNPELKSRQELLAAFDRNAADARQKISTATDAQLTKPWSLMAGPKEIFKLPRIAVLRGFILNHTIHHRGQMTVYLRLNDVPVPSIYGPSADEGNF